MKLRKPTTKEIKNALIGSWTIVTVMGLILVCLGINGLVLLADKAPDCFIESDDNMKAASLLEYPLNETAVLREEMYKLNISWIVVISYAVNFIMIILGAGYALSGIISVIFTLKERTVTQRLDKLEQSKGWVS